MRRDVVLLFQEFLRSEKRSCKGSDSHPEQVRDVGDVVLPVVTRTEVAVGVKTDVVVQIDQRAETQRAETQGVETQGVETQGVETQGVGIHRVGIHNREITQSVVEDVQRAQPIAETHEVDLSVETVVGVDVVPNQVEDAVAGNANQSPMEW